MHIEVDQSGKIGDTRVPTVLAFSNAESCAILIPASVKRACIRYLRQHKKAGTTLYLQLFSTGLYLLLKESLLQNCRITIDIEYPGHSAKVKEHLLNLLHRANIAGIEENIQFAYIGKKSNAHARAYEVFVGLRQADRTISYQEVITEFGK
jgi:hypothetical protein